MGCESNKATDTDSEQSRNTDHNDIEAVNDLSNDMHQAIFDDLSTHVDDHLMIDMSHHISLNDQFSPHDIDIDQAMDLNQQDTEDVECREHSDCVESQMVPPLPEVACGDCYAVCESNRCSTLCYEAAGCIFLPGGCGPNCESLCDTDEGCFPNYECIEGICQHSEE